MGHPVRTLDSLIATDGLQHFLPSKHLEASSASLSCRLRRQFEAFGAWRQGKQGLADTPFAQVVIISSADGAGVRSDLWPQLGALLGDGTSDVLTLHFTLVVDNDSRVVLEVQEVALSSADGLALADDDGGEHLLPQLGLTLLDGSEEHVADGGSGQAGHSGTNAGNGEHVDVLGSSVVSAVHNRGNWQTVRDLEFDAGTDSLSSLAHIDRMC